MITISTQRDSKTHDLLGKGEKYAFTFLVTGDIHVTTDGQHRLWIECWPGFAKELATMLEGCGKSTLRDLECR